MKTIIKKIAWLLVYIGIGGMFAGVSLFLLEKDISIEVKDTVLGIILLGSYALVGYALEDFLKLAKLVLWDNCMKAGFKNEKS